MVYGNYGSALVVIAIGAILKWAVTGHVSGLALGTLGVILMLCGLAWLLIAALYDFNWRRRAVVAADPVVERERIVERHDRVL